MTPAQRSALLTTAALVAALLCVVGFHDVGQRYLDYRFLYGFGVYEVPAVEIVFYLWYLLFGVPAAAILGGLLWRSRLPAHLRASLRRLASRRALLLVCATLLLAAEVFAFRTLVLEGAPIADDESTYVFIAQTLLEGRLVNPAPLADPASAGDLGSARELEFFQNQFVVLTPERWFGKYPIGHPLVLAAGEAFGVRGLVVPALTCLAFVLTFLVGRRLFPEREALLGTLLLLVSPHFVFTGATQLSQPLAGVCLLVGLLALLELARTRHVGWALACGVCFGYGVLVRPLPGLLFLAVALAWGAWTLRAEPHRRRLALAAGAPLVLFAAVFLTVNWIQTGNPLRTGYHAFHRHVGIVALHAGRTSASLAGALLRENFWLFGWPLSFVFVPFARRGPRTLLLWAMLGAACAYRVIAPKTVVATTGPIYLTEIVPLLALASGSGMLHLADWLRQHGMAGARDAVAATALALLLVTAAMFLPVQLREIHRSGRAWQAPHRLLDEAGARRALVYADSMVDPSRGDSWAYYPPNPSPRLDDAVVFVRRPHGPDAAERGLAFWRTRFPEHEAWLLEFAPRGPELRRVRGAADLRDGTGANGSSGG